METKLKWFTSDIFYIYLVKLSVICSPWRFSKYRILTVYEHSIRISIHIQKDYIDETTFDALTFNGISNLQLIAQVKCFIRCSHELKTS